MELVFGSKRLLIRAPDSSVHVAVGNTQQHKLWGSVEKQAVEDASYLLDYRLG